MAATKSSTKVPCPTARSILSMLANWAGSRILTIELVKNPLVRPRVITARERPEPIASFKPAESSGCGMEARAAALVADGEGVGVLVEAETRLVFGRARLVRVDLRSCSKIPERLPWRLVAAVVLSAALAKNVNEAAKSNPKSLRAFMDKDNASFASGQIG